MYHTCSAPLVSAARTALSVVSLSPLPSVMVVSEEVIRCSPRDVRLSSARCRVELQEGVLEVLVDLHYGSLIAAAIALNSQHTHSSSGGEVGERTG